MKLYLKRYSKIILFFVFSFQSFLIGQEAELIIEKLQNRFEMIDNFEASFDQSLKNNYGEILFRLSGKIYFEKPDKFNIDLGDKSIISNGIDVFNIDQNLGRVVISNAQDRTNSFSLRKFIYELPNLCEVKLLNKTNGINELELNPRNEIGFQKVKLKINKDDFVTVISILDNASNLIIFQLSNYKININLDSGIFDYNSQQGLEIIDLR